MGKVNEINKFNIREKGYNKRKEEKTRQVPLSSMFLMHTWHACKWRKSHWILFAFFGWPFLQRPSPHLHVWPSHLHPRMTPSPHTISATFVHAWRCSSCYWRSRSRPPLPRPSYPTFLANLQPLSRPDSSSLNHCPMQTRAFPEITHSLSTSSTSSPLLHQDSIDLVSS